MKPPPFLLFAALLVCATAARPALLPPTSIPVRVILVANDVRDSMNMVFLHSTAGWRKYLNINPANYGRGTPIWREKFEFASTMRTSITTCDVCVSRLRTRSSMS